MFLQATSALRSYAARLVRHAPNVLTGHTHKRRQIDVSQQVRSRTTTDRTAFAAFRFPIEGPEVSWQEAFRILLWSRWHCSVFFSFCSCARLII